MHVNSVVDVDLHWTYNSKCVQTPCCSKTASGSYSRIGTTSTSLTSTLLDAGKRQE